MRQGDGLGAPERRARAVLLALALAPLTLLVVEAVARPLVPGLSDAIHALVRPLCHQDPARSPWAHGHALGACYRCVGVHLGLALVAAWWPRGSLGDQRAFPFLLGLGLLDWMLCRAGASMDHPAERVIAGAALGAGLALGAVVVSRGAVRHARAVLARLRMRWTAS